MSSPDVTREYGENSLHEDDELFSSSLGKSTRNIADDIETLVQFAQSISDSDKVDDAAARVESWLANHRPVTHF